MKRTLLLLMLLLVSTIATGIEADDIPTSNEEIKKRFGEQVSSFTNPSTSWNSEAAVSNLGLAWYPVAPWEIKVCTQGLRQPHTHVMYACDCCKSAGGNPALFFLRRALLSAKYRQERGKYKRDIKNKDGNRET